MIRIFQKLTGLFIAVLFLLSMSPRSQAKTVEISYTIDMHNPNSHYFEVTLAIKNYSKKWVDFHMPVWIPGSYLVREFEKNVIDVKAFGTNEKRLKVRKIRKNIWRVQTQKSKFIRLKYKVYAYEISVRHSFLDDSHAFINPSSVCMFVKELKGKPLTVTFHPPKNWTKISTGLAEDPANRFIRFARNYDELVDCPIEIGNQTILTFSVNGIVHEISLYGNGKFQADSLVEKVKKIVETEVAIFKEIDYPRYVFLVQFQPRGGGGLEHRNSCVLQVDRWALQGKRLNGFLALVAHEYFHNWNVKRLRPKALGPFDYDRENYTWLLWVAEGFTTYYGGQTMLRAKFRTSKSYMNGLAGMAKYLASTPGNRIEPVDEASFDAWIKYYRHDENSVNTTVSYYNKGAMIATLLDLIIRHQTMNSQSLDDLMRHLYQKYYKKLNRWYTEPEFEKECETLAGVPLGDFFSRYVSGTDSIDYNRYFRYAGIELYKKGLSHQDSLRAYSGMKIASQNGNAVVRTVLAGSPAFRAGIYVNDEILAVDNFRVTASDLNEFLQQKHPRESARLLLNRRGMIREIPLNLGLQPNTDFAVRKVKKPTELQKKIYESYFKTKWERTK